MVDVDPTRRDARWCFDGTDPAAGGSHTNFSCKDAAHGSTFRPVAFIADDETVLVKGCDAEVFGGWTCEDETCHDVVAEEFAGEDQTVDPVDEVVVDCCWRCSDLMIDAVDVLARFVHVRPADGFSEGNQRLFLRGPPHGADYEAVGGWALGHPDVFHPLAGDYGQAGYVACHEAGVFLARA